MIIRPFDNKDAKGWVECHYSTVHGLAIKDYSKDICDKWATPIDNERILEVTNTGHDTVRFVAEENNVIIGIGEYVPDNNELRACYVHANTAQKGVGRSLVEKLETHAKQNGVKFFELDSSITAVPFYKKIGYDVIEEGEHELSTGLIMKCYKMRKDL